MGYGGARPAQLALAILLAMADAAKAERFYQKFKWEVLAPIASDRWTLDTCAVVRWLEAASGMDDIVRLAVEER